jgi:hypothetical protein
VFLLASAVTEHTARNCGAVASKRPEAVAILLATSSVVPGAPPPDPRAVKPKMALRAQLPVPAVRGWWSRFEPATMRVSALRHRVAGEALPGFLLAASFASRTAGTGTCSSVFLGLSGPRGLSATLH